MALIDPKNAFTNGVPKLEDLNIYAELKVFRKNYNLDKRLDDGTPFTDNDSISVINFLGFNQKTKSFTTNYTDNNENFGITSISMKLSSSYVPEVNIQFIDVRGQSLFRQSDDSPYNVLFDFPPPIFELTLKGFFGKKVKYRLHLLKQTSKFDGNSGNYVIDASFIGLTFAPLSDMPVTFLKCAPYIYNALPPVGSDGPVDTTIELISIAQTVVEKIQKATKKDKTDLEEVSSRSTRILDTFLNGLTTGNLSQYIIKRFEAAAIKLPQFGKTNGVDIPMMPNNRVIADYKIINDNLIQKMITDLDELKINRTSLNIDSFPSEDDVVKMLEGAEGQINIFRLSGFLNLEAEIKNEVAKLAKEKTSKANIIVSKAQAEAVSVFGADITIRNVFSILLNDVDLFTTKLYDVTKKVIKDPERSKFTKKDDNGNEPKALPFPTWTSIQKINNIDKRVKALPPEDFVEVKFIDELIRSILKSGLDQQEMSKPAQFDENTDTHNTDWLGINAFDSDLKVKLSPYSKLNTLSGLYKRLVSRANIFVNVSISDDTDDEIIKLYGQAEAYNIINTLKSANQPLISSLKTDIEAGGKTLNSVVKEFGTTNKSNNGVTPQPPTVRVENFTTLEYIKLDKPGLKLDYAQPVRDAFILFFKTVKERLQYDTTITSGIRTFAEQTKLHNDWLNSDRKKVEPAKPGFSKHESGYSIDVNFFKGNKQLGGPEKTKKEDWLNSEVLAIAKELKLIWGGTFNGNYDPVHFAYDEGKSTTSPTFIDNIPYVNYNDLIEIKYSGDVDFTRGDPVAYDDAGLEKLKSSVTPIQKEIYNIADELNGTWYGNLVKFIPKPKICQYNVSLSDVFAGRDLFKEGVKDRKSFSSYDNFINIIMPKGTFFGALNSGLRYGYGSSKSIIEDIFTQQSGIHKLPLIACLGLYVYMRDYNKNNDDKYPEYIIKEFAKIYDDDVNKTKVKNINKKVLDNYDTYFGSIFNVGAITIFYPYNHTDKWDESVYGELNKPVYIIISDPKDFLLNRNDSDNDNSNKTNIFITAVKNTLKEKALIVLSDEKEKQELKITKTLNDKDFRTELYYNVKSFHDRWILGDYDLFKKDGVNTFLSRFLFVDRGFNDIGDKLILDLSPIAEMDINGEISLYTLLLNILAKNSLEFFVLPNYISHDKGWEKSVEEIFGPSQDENIINSPTFICMYVGGTSSNLGVPNNMEDMNDGADYEFKKTPDLVNVNAFKVTYGEGDQSLFTSISLDQAEFKETLESIKILDQITKAQDETVVKPQNLFNIYEQRSYSCEVTMLGNVMIQPTMYFSLDIPLFRGAYLITEVSHSIQPNHMMTTFKGVRVPDHTKPLVESYTLYAGISTTDIEPQTTGTNTGSINTGNGSSNKVIKDSSNSPTLKQLGNKIDKAGKIKNPGLTPKMKAMLDTLAYTEATIDAGKNGYNVLVGFREIPGWTPEYGFGHQRWYNKDKDSTASGRYQFNYFTWLGIGAHYKAKNLISDPNDPKNKAMSEHNQDILASLKINELLESKNLNIEKINENNATIYFDALAPTWVSFPKLGNVGASKQHFEKGETVKKIYFEVLLKYS